MPNNELYKITATLQQKNNPTASVATPLTAAEKIMAYKPIVDNISQGTRDAEGLEILRPVEKTVSKEAIYDRLNDGSYIAKFENYIGAEGNENRLAKEQSTGEKWGHGATKMVAKIGTYAFDSVVGTAYGIGAAIGTGQWSKLYDNDFASAMDDVNKRLDNNFANYYSDEEKSMSVLQSMGTANFWANDVTGGLAFVGGAILPSIALGALTGGATLSAGAGKLASKWGMNIAKQTAEEGLEAAGKSGIKNYVKTKLASGLGSVVDKGAFFARTASFEAGMEARQSYKTNVQDFYTKFEEQNGRMPTTEEAKPFLEDARNASNGVYGVNLAILSVSNAVMFGKKIVPTAVTNKLGGITNQFNKAIGLGVKTEMIDGVLTKSMIQATKGQKLLGNIYKISKKPLTEGLYEEGFQGVTTKTAANYLDAKYSPKNTETISLMANLADGFKEQYGSNEGWKEMAIGMIIGFGGGGMSPGAFKKGSGAFSGLGSDSRASTQKQMEADLKRSNEGVVSFRNLNRTEGARAFAVTGADGKVARNYEDSVAGYNFIKSQEAISTPGQIQEDHNRTIDAMEFQDPEMKEFLADRGVTEQEYKDSLKSSFDTTLKQYRKASSHVKALGLDRAIKDTEGNKIEIGEAIVLNTMLGMSSLEESKKHLDQLDKLMGTSGTFDAHEFYQSLSEEQQDQITLLDKKTAELEELKKQATLLGEQAAGSRASTGQTSDQLTKQRVQTSEKAFQAQQAVIRVTQEIQTLTEGLSSNFDAHQAEQRANDPNKLPQDINSVLNKLREANSYVNSLTKAGETATTTAGTVKYLVGQAKYHSDAHREMVNMNRRMLSTNFFSSKEGKSFVGRILGKTYVMSDELRKSITDNDAFIDTSLRLMGQRGSESDTVMDRIQKALEANPNLSEREKHRLEDLLRLQLTGNAAAAIVKDLTTASEQIAAMQIEDTKGDTVALAQKLKLREQDLTNLGILTTAIDEITNELDSIINANGNNSAEISKLKEELQTLKEKRDAIKESIRQEEILNQQSSSSQREGTSSGQQEEGESEGIERETTTNETDNSNSTIPSEAQQEIERRRQEDLQNGEIFIFNDGTYGGSRNVSLNFYSDVQIKEGKPEDDVRTWDYKNYNGTGIFVNKQSGVAYIVPNNTFSKTPQVFKVFIDKKSGKFDLNNPRIINKPNIEQIANAYKVSIDAYYNEVMNAITKYDAELAELKGIEINFEPLTATVDGSWDKAKLINDELENRFKNSLEEGDKIITGNNETLFFKNGKIVKKDGKDYGMSDIPTTAILSRGAKIYRAAKQQQTVPSQTQTEEEKIAYLENSKLDNNAANRKLAEIAKNENIDLSKLTREEYVTYAIKNGLRISDTELRNAPELRTPTTMDETMALRKSLRESLTEKTKEIWNKWTNAIEVLATKSQQERYILNGVRVLSGTAKSNSWLFFDINNSQVDSTQAPYKSYFSLKDFNNITPEQVVKFMEFLQQKGYKGGIKTFQDLENQGVLLNDQFVLHGDTEADAKLGEELAKEFFKEEIKSTGLGKDGFENGKSKSYSQILSDKISNSIDDIINGKITIEQQTTPPTQTSQQEIAPEEQPTVEDTVEELEVKENKVKAKKPKAYEKLRLKDVVGQKVYYKGKSFIVKKEGGKYVLENNDTIYELEGDNLSELGIKLYDINVFQSKYIVSNISENEVTINGVDYIINTDEKGNVKSLSPKNNPTQELTNERLLISTEIERNKIEFTNLAEATQDQYDNLLKTNADGAVLDQIYNKNYSDTVDRGLEKLMAGEKLSPSEKLALDLWVTEALINLTNVYSKTPSEALAAGMDILEGINIKLYTYEEQTESIPETSNTSSEQQQEETNSATELDKINAEIEALENRIKKLEGERYQIIESQEYIRFTQLSAKKEKGELTPNEEAELEELKDDLDKWTMITGIVIDGFRLSDLIEQKVVLESTPIIAPENVVVQETAETMNDVDIPDKVRGANTQFGNTAHKVIFSTEGTGDKKIYTIYHLTQDGLIKEIGNLPIKTDRLDERNNILLTAEEVRLINENTDLKIITDSKYSRASTVIKAKLMPDGSIKYVGLDSDFNNELREGIDFPAVYEAEPGDEIEVFVDPKSDYNKENLARIRNLFKELAKVKKNPVKTKAIKDQIKAEKVWLQENLQVMARINGRVVAMFKGIRGGVKNDTDLLFAEFRKAIISDDNNLAALTSDTANGVITVKVKGKDLISRKPVITVKQVLMGIPNYNYDQNEDGAMVTVFKPIPEQQQVKIVDIGYSLNGKTFTRDGKTVNTTFLANMTKRNKTGKIPFVVLEVGGKRVAYPVRVENAKDVNTEEFEAIYNSERSDSDKAKSLNRFMAANGIDIKEAGNAFISFGVTNLTDENFQNKLAQLKAINYFYNVEDWIAEDSNMKDILTNQVTIDIDVENPFHSPKLMFDYSQLDLAKGKVTKESTATQTSNNIDDEAEESSIFC